MTTAPHRAPRDLDPPPVVVVHLRDSSLTDDLARLRSEVATTVLHCRGGITVDLSAVDQISSPTVAAILWARRSCSARRIPFAVTGDHGRNARVLRSCGLLGANAGSRW